MIRGVPVSAALFLFAAASAARAEIDIVPVTSPGGIEAWLYEDHTLPIVTIAASFLGGASLDPEGREGATFMMTALLQEGAGDLDATAFATAREAVASPMGFWASDDAVTVAATMLVEARDATAELLGIALAEPRFDPDAVDRIRRQAAASIRMREFDPNSLGSNALYALAYPDHPYGRPIDGTLESVTSLTADDLRAAHAAAIARNRLRVAAVGAIDPEELGALLDRVFGDLPAIGAALPPLAEPAMSGARVVIDFDSPQSVVIFANAGLRHGDPDFIPAMVMDYILGGGGFSSRLTKELREKRGLTYGVYTYLAALDLGGLYVGSFSSSNARVEEALEVLRAEWRRLAEEGVTEVELGSAKRYLTGEYPLRFEGGRSIAQQLLGIQVAGLGIDYVNQRDELIEAVTSDDVARVARRLLKPDALTMVIVGRPEIASATPKVP